MTFSSRTYRSLQSRLRVRYDKHLAEILKIFKKNSSSKTSQWVLENARELRGYSPLKWFLLEQLKTFHFFSEAQSELSDEFGSLEDEVFERWNKSEFADVFLKSLNEGVSFSKASARTLKLFDQHLVALGNRQILRAKTSPKSYKPQVALGDTFHDKRLGKLLETVLHLEGKDLGLMTTSIKEMKEFSDRIDIALKVIRKFSPTSWERFVSFTDTIIPIKDDEFVSYSHQEMPGVSMINLYNRDFIDLLDDLLHENGHHHLNYYLNLSKLIEEPLDSIYYSPWRRTLRPLRGIYHAYFTFFWAFKLFSDLSSAKEQDSIWYLFSEREKEKMLWRAVEEFYMLEYTYRDLQTAWGNGLIHKRGWDLIQSQRKELLKFKKKIVVWERKLKTHKKDLKVLKHTLLRASKEYWT